MLKKQVTIAPSLQLRPFTLSAPINDTAPSSKPIQQNAMNSIEEMISQHKIEASKLRQEMIKLKPGRAIDIQMEKLWEYMLVTTRLENMRDALELERLCAERREVEQGVVKEVGGDKIRCCEDVDGDTNDDVKEDEEPEDGVGNNTRSINDNNHRTDEENKTKYKYHNTHNHQKQQTRNALSAVQNGGTVLNKAHYEVWDWLCANRSNAHIPEEFRQMMEQHLHALATDLVHMKPRVEEEVEGRLGG